MSRCDCSLAVGWPAGATPLFAPDCILLIVGVLWTVLWENEICSTLGVAVLPGIRAVALRSNGKPCCVYNFESAPLATPITRSLYHGWSGEPCALRTYAGAISCELD